MERLWKTPRGQVDEFVPNECIGLCWKIRCEVPASTAGSVAEDPVQGPTNSYGDDVTHATRSDGTGCGYATNNAIYTTSTGVYSINEVNTAGLGTLTTSLRNAGSADVDTDSSSWSNLSSSIGSVQIGDLIYWTTQSGRKKWYHYGHVDQLYPGHPNRS